MLEPEQTDIEAPATAGAPARDAANEPADTPASGSGTGSATKEQVLEALKAVVDPELGINIVDLGLVYEVTIDEGDVHVEYTLTTMGCPIGPLIEAQMQEAAAKVEGVSSLTPEMVLRPAWTPEMMSDDAKAALGFF
ncbi:MAG: metal-sulfur cluster assembly factor [Actinomycetota bacterium]